MANYTYKPRVELMEIYFLRDFIKSLENFNPEDIKK